jgi:hypothetical protein
MTNLDRLSLSVLIVALLLGAACKHSEDGRNFKPSPLAGKLHSGQSLESVEQALGLSSGDYDVVMDRAPLPSDTRPLYRLLIISEKHASLSGQTGRLVLTFYNNRLMTTQFYPSDMTATRAAVERAQELSLGSGEAHISPSTRVWIGKDENKQAYIGWIDKSLQREQDAWLKQYESQ